MSIFCPSLNQAELEQITTFRVTTEKTARATLILWQHRDVTGISEDQASSIRAWLSGNGFRKLPVQEGQPEHWFCDGIGIRFTRRGQRYRVDVLHAIGGQGWRGIDELLTIGNSWPEAPTIPPIEMVTSPQLYAGRRDLSFRRVPGDWLYRKAKPWAHGIKVFLQMIVGIGAIIDIGWHVFNSVSNHKGTAPLAPSIKTSVAVIVSALAVAAAIELAYTLFTPGPDEALEPLMLGLSSGILFLITENVDKNLSAPAQFSAVLLGVLALGVLFLIRRSFLRDDDD